MRPIVAPLAAAALTVSVVAAAVFTTQTTASAAVTVPGAPASCSAVDASNAADVSWSAPASDGGAAITRYVVKIKGQATPVVQIDDGTARTYHWTTAYLATSVFQVRAVNSVGFGAWCETPIGPGPSPSPTPTPTATPTPSPTPTPTPTPTATATATITPPPPGRPYIPYSSTAWLKQTIGGLGLSQNSTKTSAMRTYINSHDKNKAPNINGIAGKGWADAYGGLATCSDPYFKIGTGNALVPFLKTTGFHAKVNLNGDINSVTGTDLPFTVIDRCGNSAMPSGFVVKGTGAITAGGAGTQANPYVINVGGYAGAYDAASNGLNFDVPTSNGPSNKTSRGVIPASAVIRADQVQYGINNTSDLGQRLELFWWETDSNAGKISPPMAGFESGQFGWGAEGQVVGVDPAFVPSGTCSAGAKVVIRTLQNYGAYIGDNAGNGGSSLKAEEDHGQWAGLGLSVRAFDACGLTWNNFVAY